MCIRDRVGTNQIRIDGKSRRELTRSKYTQNLQRTDRQVYEDKFKSLRNADEILQATQNFRSEAPKHPRKDKIIGFLRGDVMLRIGNNEYTAEVVVGEEGNGSLLLYDIIKIQKTQIRTSLKEKDAGHVVISSEEDVDRLPASNNSISNPDENVKGKFSLKSPVEEYQAGNEEGRLAKLNSLDDVRFSLKHIAQNENWLDTISERDYVEYGWAKNTLSDSQFKELFRKIGGKKKGDVYPKTNDGWSLIALSGKNGAENIIAFVKGYEKAVSYTHLDGYGFCRIHQISKV